MRKSTIQSLVFIRIKYGIFSIFSSLKMLFEKLKKDLKFPNPFSDQIPKKGSTIRSQSYLDFAQKKDRQSDHDPES